MSVQTRLAMFINAEVRDLESAEPIINAFRCRSVYRICYEFQSIDRTDERIYPSKFSHLHLLGWFHSMFVVPFQYNGKMYLRLLPGLLSSIPG